MALDWSQTAAALKGFGGEPVTLTVRKSGLPFFDALQLYGAIDLYIGVREDVRIHDAGRAWQVIGRCRAARLKGRDERILRGIKGNLKPKPKISVDDYCRALRLWLGHGGDAPTLEDTLHQANGPFSEFDSALQSGIRGVAATSYGTLESGQSTAQECIARIPLSRGLLALVGKARTEAMGDILFLPIFEGQIDLSKVVSPVRARLASPNALCAQALMLLALKTSLFAEGYQQRLRSVVYNKRVKRGDFAYSGQIEIASTAVETIKSAPLISRLHQVLRGLVFRAWSLRKPELIPDAMTMARWVMHPVPKNLSALITSQERLKARGLQHVFTEAEHVGEIATMTYGKSDTDMGNVQKFARAVARAIYYARMEGAEDSAKRWYDEVATLRSSPNEKAFFSRALNLLELGHRQNTFVGTEEEQLYDPEQLRNWAGSNFEKFRDIFRMYLLQESRPGKRASITSSDPNPVAGENEGDSSSATESEEVDE